MSILWEVLGNDVDRTDIQTDGRTRTDRKKRGSEEKQVGVCKITFTPKEVPTIPSHPLLVLVKSSLEKFNYELGLACSFGIVVAP